MSSLRLSSNSAKLISALALFHIASGLPTEAVSTSITTAHVSEETQLGNTYATTMIPGGDDSTWPSASTISTKNLPGMVIHEMAQVAEGSAKDKELLPGSISAQPEMLLDMILLQPDHPHIDDPGLALDRENSERLIQGAKEENSDSTATIPIQSTLTPVKRSVPTDISLSDLEENVRNRLVRLEPQLPPVRKDTKKVDTHEGDSNNDEHLQ